jgi:polyferredoxin
MIIYNKIDFKNNYKLDSTVFEKSPFDKYDTMIQVPLKKPADLPKQRINYSLKRSILKRIILRLKSDSQFQRSTIQITFVLLCIWIGIEFYYFMKWGESAGNEIYVSRPPGAEGFLPISALISLKYWLQTGIINSVHPSGLFIFIAIVATGLLLKKAFCSWLCPIGTISESLWMFGKKIFKKNLSIKPWLDYPLRTLKYLLLGFFFWSIWQMDVFSLKAFIFSPYNKVADIKMYLFFANISSFALWTIIIFILLSIIVKNFWCRYLCPYGALLGMISWLSPLKISRNETTCIDCELCTKVCPANIKVHKVKKVWSDECTGCLECVEVCPVKNTLDMQVSSTSIRIPNWIFGILVVGVFIAITGLGIITGHWQNIISKEEYLKRFQELDSPLYQHNRGQVPEYSPND